VAQTRAQQAGTTGKSPEKHVPDPPGDTGVDPLGELSLAGASGSSVRPFAPTELESPGRLPRFQRDDAAFLQIRSRQTVSRRPSQLAANTKTSLGTLGTLDSIKKRRSMPRLREEECDLAGLSWLANGSRTKLALSPLLFTTAKNRLAPFILASVLGKMYKNFSPGQRI